eukprot:UN08269
MWICSYNYYFKYDSEYFADYNTPIMWVFFCFAIIIVLMTVFRLLWKVFMTNKYDAAGTIRKISFGIRMFLDVAAMLILTHARRYGELKEEYTFNPKMGTMKMAKFANGLIMIDIIGWIVDCCLHWIIYGFPHEFRGFLMPRSEYSDARINFQIPIFRPISKKP